MIGKLAERCARATRALETARLAEPVDAASLGAFRILLGLVVALGAVRFCALGWVEDFYARPAFFFAYPGLELVRPLPAPLLYAVFGALTFAALALASGRAYRVASVATFALFTYVELLDRTTYLNHYYLTSLLLGLACVLPLDRALVLGRKGSGDVPRFAVVVLRVQLGFVYFFAGVAKLRPDWLVDGLPLALWLRAYDHLPYLGGFLSDPRTAIAMSWAGAVFDLGVPFALSFARTRPFAYAAVVAFHTITGLLFPIGVFPLVMIVATTVFFPPSWPRRYLRPSVPEGTTIPRPTPRALPALLAVYLVIQLVLPLRRFAYPGDTAWTEDGFRFAWQVMLVEKTGLVGFVIERGDGRRRLIDPRDELRPHQLRQMYTQPDLVLAYAHHLRDAARARGEGDVAVYADAWVSWNGRLPQRFIRPDVDLARIPDDLGSATRYVEPPEVPQRWWWER